MKFSPSIEEVQKIAATGEYKALPVSCEMLSDICTPIEALRILKKCILPLLSVGVSGGEGEVGTVHIPGIRSQDGDHLRGRRDESGECHPAHRGSV